MSVAVEQRPVDLGRGHGGMPARRAVLRWAWRLFRRQWRQQSLVLAMLLLSVATTTAGLAIAANAIGTQEATFGTANYALTLGSIGAQADADVAELRSSFGTIDVIEHQAVAVPGSANPIDLRAQDPHGPYAAPTLRLLSGRYPRDADEVAITEQVATIFHLSVGGVWDQGGTQRRVVGLVENPFDLRSRFALVAPGRLAAPERIDVLIKVTQAEFDAKPHPDRLSRQVRTAEDAVAVPVLALSTIGLLFVGLLAVAGFTVLAQRRLRALGMLGAMGASRRHLRLVLVANGAVVGAAGAIAGAVTGVLAWTAFAPAMEPLLGRRIDRFELPWLPIVAAVLLAVVTAIGAAWWPARAAARVPVVAALSARPVPPRPAHRFAAPGVVLLAAGLVALVLARQTRAFYIVSGVLATALGLLLLAPLGIAGLGRLARFAPVAARLALRDLARYRARSSAALAAIALAVAIAAVIALSAAVAVARATTPTGGNLPPDQLVVWVSEHGTGGPIPELTAAQLDTARLQADELAHDLGGGAVLPLTAVRDADAPRGNEGRPVSQIGPPQDDGAGNIRFSGDNLVTLFLATPELLSRYRIDPAGIAADTDVLTNIADISDYELVPGRHDDWKPKVQHVDLPAFSSLPGSLITEHGAQALHLTPATVGWLVRVPHPLTQAEVDRAEDRTRAAGLSLETRPTGADALRLARYATGTGVAVALGVLAMTVGLIRSESARDLRTLTAAGAPRRVRRSLTGSTAGALALLGAVIGTGVAYLAMLAWYHRETHWLTHAPLAELAAVLAGLPLLAYAGGWLLAGREAPAVARSPLD
jgi:putative ABC transport system permease protein